MCFVQTDLNFFGNHYWQCNDTCVTVCLCLCVLFICLCWQRVSVIVVCLLETAAEDVNLSSAELLQLLSIHHGLCWWVLFSVCAVRWNSRLMLSANRSLCLTHNERATLARPAVFVPVFVFVKSVWRITQTCQQSSLLTLKRTALRQWLHTNRLLYYYIFLRFFFFSSCFHHCHLSHTPPHTLRFPAIHTASLSYVLLFFSHRPCVLLALFLPLTSSQPYPLSFSLVIPPALLLLSRTS